MRYTLILVAYLSHSAVSWAGSPSDYVLNGRPVTEWLGLSGGLASSQEERIRADQVLDGVVWTDEAAVSAIFAAMRHEKWPIAYAASQRFVRFGTNAVPLLITGTTDESKQMRHASMAALASLESIPPEIIPVAVRGLRDDYDQVAGQAIFLLRKASQHSGDTVARALVPILEDDDDSLRLKAFMILEAMRSKGKLAMSALAVALSRTEYPQSAASALASMGSEAIPHLVGVVRDGGVEAARAAARALRQFDPLGRVSKGALAVHR